MAAWAPIKDFDRPDHELVDIWLSISASPSSMGWADDFRVVDAYRIGGRWFHRSENGAERELIGDYITHWMPPPAPPTESATKAA